MGSNCNVAVGRNQDGRLEVFAARDGDWSVYHCWQSSANSLTWSSFVKMAPVGPVSCALNVGKNSDGRLEIFYKHSSLSKALTHQWQVEPNSGWSTSEYLHSSDVLTAMPDNGKIAVGNYDNGRLAVFAIGNRQVNGAIHVKYQTGPTSWGSWIALAN